MIGCGILAVVVLAVSAVPATSSSAVRVIDGDTIEIDGTVHRIWGIDAPEAGQDCRREGGGQWPCGKAAIKAMDKLVVGHAVACDDRGEDGYGRVLSACTSDGTDIGRALVEGGFAWSFRKYAPDYDAVEDLAHDRRVGIWQAPTETAWEYRQHRWDGALQEAPEGCPIKGNINRDGERIYHAPWSPWYRKTTVDPKHGEQWFCSEGEALAAGWRAPYWGQKS